MVYSFMFIEFGVFLVCELFQSDGKQGQLNTTYSVQKCVKSTMNFLKLFITMKSVGQQQLIVIIFLSIFFVFQPKRKLKKGAIPCLFYMKKCCVPNCTNETGRMYKFPIMDENNLMLWIYLVKNPAVSGLSKAELLKHRVCYRHFEKGSFDKNGDLVKSAAPTLLMPGK